MNNATILHILQQFKKNDDNYNYKNDICPIIQTEFDDNEIITQLPCQHCFNTVVSQFQKIPNTRSTHFQMIFKAFSKHFKTISAHSKHIKAPDTVSTYFRNNPNTRSNTFQHISKQMFKHVFTTWSTHVQTIFNTISTHVTIFATQFQYSFKPRLHMSKTVPTHFKTVSTQHQHNFNTFPNHFPTSFKTCSAQLQQGTTTSQHTFNTFSHQLQHSPCPRRVFLFYRSVFLTTVDL